MEASNFTIVCNDDGDIVNLIFSKETDATLQTELCALTNDERFYDNEVKTTPEEMTEYIPKIKARFDAGCTCLGELLMVLEDCNIAVNSRYEQMKKDNKVTFDTLNKLFAIGSKFVTDVNHGKNQIVGSTVTSTHIEVGSYQKRYFCLSGNFIVATDKKFVNETKQFYIEEFSGLKTVDTLSIRPMTDEAHALLTERGKQFAKYGVGCHHIVYSGAMFMETGWGPVYFGATGRAMTDKLGFDTVNPNYARHYGQTDGMTEIPDDLLYSTWNTLFGFSFVAKRWGQMFVNCIKDVIYDDCAYDSLVIDEDRKKIIKALVTKSGTGFTDLISGKSGGTILLFHGDPGTGKTLTCEAIAELLHVPLYSITAGELGITPDILEKKLSQILEITVRWNASILLDEADIFLEARTSSDILRNAMVGIFLRLLERNAGVIFLTTNRADSMDPAFKSRISMIFEYKNLSHDSRKQVWTNLLKASSCSVPDVDIVALAEYPLNGRQIKNAIRMAQSLAFDDSEIVTREHLDRIISYV